MTKTEFETVWWEMEEIEPLTPIINLRNETNEIPSPVQITKKEKGFLLTSESDTL
jgi:hypothetical protein